MAAIFVISKALSFTFREVVASGTLPTFDNTFWRDEEQPDGLVKDYCQPFLTTETKKVQVRNNYSSVVATIKNAADLTIVTPAVTKVGDYLATLGYNYHEFDVDMSLLVAGTKYYIQIVGTDGTYATVTHKSEAFQPDTSLDFHLKINYYNFETAYDIDYTNNTITNTIWIPATLKPYIPGGKITVYNNQGKQTKLSAQSVRILELWTNHIPRSIAEKITTALDHDYVTVNNVRFVTDEKPEIEDNPSNQVSLKANLTQFQVIGLNDDDSGIGGTIVATDDVKPLELAGVTGAQQVTLDNNFYPAAVIFWLASGASATIKVGWTVGGSEILSLKTCTATNKSTWSIAFAPPNATNTTIYVTIAGVGSTLNVNIPSIRYKEDTP